MRGGVVCRRVACVALGMLACVSLALAQADSQTSLDAAREAAAKAGQEKAAADKVLAEKAAALKAATEKLAAARAAVEQAAKAPAAARKAAEAATAAEKAAAEAKAAAAKTAAEAKGAAEAKAAADKAAAEARAASERAATERAAAEKVVGEKAVALKAAEAKVAAERTAIEKSVAEARNAAGLATKAREAAERVATPKVATAQATAARATASRAAAEKAAAEKAAAEKALADTTAVAKKAADKATADTDAAKKKDLQEAARKAESQQKAAEKTLAERTKAAQAAADRAEADKATAEKAAAEKATAERDLEAKLAAERTALSKAIAGMNQLDGGLKLLDESQWDYAKARHLLVRAGFGGTPAEVERQYKLGLHGAVAYLVDYREAPLANISFEAVPPERPHPFENRLSQDERFRISARRQRLEAEQMQRLREWWLRRMVESPRPLQEKLSLFWHGHFATEYQKVFGRSYAFYLQNQLFREHAAGNFGALLYGIIRDPVMIVYLDNQTNVKGRPNENLAREIMELFAMGVDQGYTEQDIREGARALTGFTYDSFSAQFRFNYNAHDTSPKTIFGQTGTWTGDDFVRLILQQPATARFIAGKLFEYFAYSNPDAGTVDRLAALLRANQYELGPMLKNLFASEEFYSSKAMGTQIKSPVQLVVGTLRDLAVKNGDYRQLYAAIRDMKQDLFQPPNVKGWEGGRDWVNANLIFMRHNHLANVIQSVPGPDNQRGIDLVGLLEGKGCDTPGKIVEYLVKCCLVVPLTDGQRQQLTDYISALPPATEWSKQRDQINARLRALLVLLLAVPEYQLT